jgi:hypothetical protein
VIARLICALIGHKPMILGVDAGWHPDRRRVLSMTFCARCDIDLGPEEPHAYPDLMRDPHSSAWGKWMPPR